MQDVSLPARVKARLIDGTEAECAGRSVEMLAAERDAHPLKVLALLNRNQ